MSFPLDGPNPKMAAFMMKCAQSYEILAEILMLSKEDQEYIWSWLMQKRAERIKNG